jgi:deazaflavin-dependent oxidoreductase (nitroreductase family)
MPSDLVLKVMNTVHRTVMTLSGGHLGWQAGKMPVIELTTIGRKTGQRRSVLLTSPVQDGASFVVVASKGGEDTHPAWYLNLVAHPDVEVSTRGSQRRPMRARVATAEERERVWPQVTAMYSGYAGYQSRTDREIPLIYLDPVDPPR